jgi:DNA-binding transcriptional LysR family regulator
MDLRQLRYFIAVAEELSFTRAAQRLNISQPPLSLQIQALERSLAARLLNRTSRQVELTEAGVALLAHAKAILDLAGRARDEVKAIDAGRMGGIEIGATGSILRGGLAEFLIAYRARYPQVATRVHEQAPALQIKALLDRSTDVSLNRSPTSDVHLQCEIAWQEDVVVAVPSYHPWAKRASITVEELRDEDQIVLRPDSSEFAMHMQQICVDAGFLPRVSQQVVDAQSIPSLIVAGFGIALVPASIARQTSNEVRFLKIAPRPPSADVYLVYRRDENSAATRSFIEMSRSFFAGKQAKI